MLEFFKDGGWSMFVILAFGCVAIASAGVHAVKPERAREGFLGGMARAVLWATLAGIASDLGTVFKFVCTIPDDGERGRTLLEGCAESMSPALMGFAMLAVAALLGAVGRRRLDARAAA